MLLMCIVFSKQWIGCMVYYINVCLWLLIVDIPFPLTDLVYHWCYGSISEFVNIIITISSSSVIVQLTTCWLVSEAGIWCTVMASPCSTIRLCPDNVQVLRVPDDLEPCCGWPSLPWTLRTDCLRVARTFANDLFIVSSPFISIFATLCALCFASKSRLTES